MADRPIQLLSQVRDTIRLKHYPIRTGDTYVSWTMRYILFYSKRHPREQRARALWGKMMQPISEPFRAETAGPNSSATHPASARRDLPATQLVTSPNFRYHSFAGLKDRPEE